MRPRSKRWQNAFAIIGAQTETRAERGQGATIRGGSRAVPRAAQRMPPVVPTRWRVHGPHVMQMTVFLPQFVGEKKRDDEQRNHQKRAQYQLLDHGSLQAWEHQFIVEHRTCPYRCAPLITRARSPGTTHRPALAAIALRLAHCKNALRRSEPLQELLPGAQRAQGLPRRDEFSPPIDAWHCLSSARTPLFRDPG
jgi:hypothetical protein